MRRLLGFLIRRPWTGLEIILASLLANALALATPIFVIQVLNRYIAFGVDATLATLAGGAVIAIAFEFAFRRVRIGLAEQIVGPGDAGLGERALNMLVKSGIAAFQLLSPTARAQIVSGADTLRTAYAAPNLVALIDVPFSLLFLAALALLDFRLALIGVGFATAVLIIGRVNGMTMRGPAAEMQSAAAARTGLATFALRAPDSVRLFDIGGRLADGWRQTNTDIATQQARIAARQDFAVTLHMALQSLMSVAIIGVGALLVVNGDLSIGVLIGANILAARALIPLTRLGGMARAFAAAQETERTFGELGRLPMERSDGTAMSHYNGAVAFDDVGFAYPGSRAPLLESLSVEIAPGQTLAVTGPNGSGKSTVAQLVAGLRAPTRGRVLADGIDVQQLNPAWWRRQIGYLPQEPRFLPGTIRDNLLAANPDLDDAALSRLIDAAGLRRFVDESAEGIGMRIEHGGDTLALGIRRRLALARALAVGGTLMIVDEPTEGLDDEGKALVYMAMNRHAEAGGTIVACAHDPHILKGADWVIDLARKPQPRVSRLPRPAAADGAPAPNQEQEFGG